MHADIEGERERSYQSPNLQRGRRGEAGEVVYHLSRRRSFPLRRSWNALHHAASAAPRRRAVERHRLRFAAPNVQSESSKTPGSSGVLEDRMLLKGRKGGGKGASRLLRNRLARARNARNAKKKKLSQYT